VQLIAWEDSSTKGQAGRKTNHSVAWIFSSSLSAVFFIGDPISDRIADYCNDLEGRFR